MIARLPIVFHIAFASGIEPSITDRIVRFVSSPRSTRHNNSAPPAVALEAIASIPDGAPRVEDGMFKGSAQSVNSRSLEYDLFNAPLGFRFAAAAR
jgi:hypothetical protein